MSPGYPEHVRYTKVRKPSGEVVTTTNARDDGLERHRFGIHVRPYPRAFPKSQYAAEIIDTIDMCVSSAKGRDPGVVLGVKEAWAFNFALEDGWEVKKQQFSFAKQFPKCTKWLTFPTKSAYWMTVERGGKIFFY